MFSLMRSRRATANRAVIERLNEHVVAAVRNPVFYTTGEVADTFNGRFELLVLHCALVVRRLRQGDEPGPSAAQALVDLVFRNLDPALRELGVGDMAVPKRMKRLVEGYLGRSVAYDAALKSGDRDGLASALSRNVYGGERGAGDLADYAVAAAAALDRLDSAALLRGPLPFPDAAAFLVQSRHP